MPDQELFIAAQSDQLSNSKELFKQVNRLLKSDNAKRHLGDFAAQWLATDKVLVALKDNKQFSQLTGDIRQAMDKEVRDLLSYVVLESGGQLSEFYDSNYVIVPPELAKYYQLPSDFEGVQKINALNHRGGILTTGAFLSVFSEEGESSPIERSVAVRERLLCQHVPAPLTDDMSTVITVDKDLLDALTQDMENGLISNRYRNEKLTQGDGCNVCHEKIINPIGFGMEDYDAIGRYRVKDSNSIEIDASGILYGLDGLHSLDTTRAYPFYGTKQLSTILSQSKQAEQCFVEKFSKYTFGAIPQEVLDRELDDSCFVKKQESSAKQLLLQLVQMKSLIYRKSINENY